MSKFSNWTKNTKGFFEALIARDYPTPNDRPYVKSITYEVKRYEENQITYIDTIKNGSWYSYENGESFHAPVLVEEIPTISNNGDMYIKTVFTVEYTWYYSGGIYTATYVPTTLNSDEYALVVFLEEHPEWLYFKKGTEKDPYKAGDDLEVYFPNDNDGSWITDIKSYIENYALNYDPNKPPNATSVQIILSHITVQIRIYDAIWHFPIQTIRDLWWHNDFGGTVINPPIIYEDLQDTYPPNFTDLNKTYLIRATVSSGYSWFDSDDNIISGGSLLKDVLSRDEVNYAIYNNNTLSTLWDITFEEEVDYWKNGEDIPRIAVISQSYPVLDETNVMSYFFNLIKNDLGNGTKNPIINQVAFVHYLLAPDKETEYLGGFIGLYHWILGENLQSSSVPYINGYYFQHTSGTGGFLQVYCVVHFAWETAPSVGYQKPYLIRTPSGKIFLEFEEGP